MRLLINSMTLVMALVILVATVGYHRAKILQEQNMLTVQRGLDQFDEHLMFHGALWQSEQKEAVGDYPPQVMPAWFKDGQPSNPLLVGDRPWINIAPADDYSKHPPDPLVDDLRQAAFWYNPNNGIVRARVPRQVSDRLTLALYNDANFTGLTTLPWDDGPDRVPLAFNPNPVTTGLHASPIKHATGEVQTQEPDSVAEASGVSDGVEPAPWYEQRTEPAGLAVVSDTADEQPPNENRPSLLAE